MTDKENDQKQSNQGKSGTAGKATAETGPEAGSDTKAKTLKQKPQKASHLPDPLALDDLPTNKNTIGKKQTQPRRRTRRRSPWPLLITLFLLAAVGAGGYYGWGYWQQWQSQGDDAQQALQTQLDEQAQRLNQLQQQLQAQLQELQQSDVTDTLAREVRQLDATRQQQLDELQRRVTSQGSRLRDLSTSTRDDWLLAEAEYLLRLANQRLLTERSTDSPVSLLQTADAILKDFDDPDLFAVRGQIANDITALKIATVVDREGLYLKLNALSNTIPQLTLLFDLNEQRAEAEQIAGDEDQSQTWGDRVASQFGDFAEGLKDYVRIRQRDKPLEPLLGVEEEQILRHNLRVMLEQAQLALLREEPQVYAASLEKCQQWLQQYFQQDKAAEVFAEDLQALSQQTVTSQLPEISASLQALRNYINLWHLRHEKPAAQAESQPEAGSQAETEEQP